MIMPVRIKAFLVHLSLSCLLALAALLLVFGLWYPSPLDKAVGVKGVFLILLGVDVVLGPLLTLLVYKPGKKSLRFDLATIVFLQLAAFAYGLFTVAEGRPAWLVFNVDHFELMQAYEIDHRKQDAALSEFRRPSLQGPSWAALRSPESLEERSAVLSETITAGILITQRQDFYRPLAMANDQIRHRAKPLDELKRFNDHLAVDSIIAKWPKADVFLPMTAREQPVTVLINKETAQVIAIVDLKPTP